jgi:hypothetical protein
LYIFNVFSFWKGREMKNFSIILLVCFMVSGVAFATNSWKATGGEIYWSEASGWSNGLPADTEQCKLANNSGAQANCTLNSTVSLVANKLTVGGTATSGLEADAPILYIVGGANLTIGNELQVGDSSSKRGKVIQTGGTLNATGKIEVGYKSTAGFGGTYTISGGTIADAGGGRLMVGGGGAAGSEGVFTIQGSAASITTDILYVGCSSSTGTYAGTGTIAFEVQNGAVSAINAGSVYIDPIAAAASITALIVSSTGTAPISDILLINNTGGSAVSGIFDNAAEGALFNVGGVDMTLTYVGGTGNDVVLLIPEPATLALLSLGLAALRRRK